MNSGKDLSRRAFVAGTVGSTVAASLRAAKPPSPRVIGANDRLRIGIIGMGSQALGHVRRLQKMTESDNIEITAVCDIYQKRLEEGAALTKAKPYKSYLDLIEQPDVDYVLIASPEHWHDQMILDTADAGKHIYCEKPMTFSVEGGLKAIKKIDQTGVKMQVGVQGMSDDSYETAYRYIKEGALGKVVLAQIDYSRNHIGDFWTETVDEDVRPGENLDWKAFLGSAKKRPFDADRFFAWRRYWDYSGGVATDLFIHRLTRIIKACGLTVPSQVVATGGKFVFRESPAEIPDTFNVLIDYPEGMTVSLVNSMANAAPIRHLIRGHEATLEFTREGFFIEPEKEFADKRSRIEHKKTGAEDLTLHHRNLINAIRLNEPLKCDARLGFYGMLACRMAVDSYRKKQYLAWDPRREKVVKA